MRRDVRVVAGGKRRSSNCLDGGCLQSVSGNRGLRGSPIVDAGNEEGGSSGSDGGRELGIGGTMDGPPLQPLQAAILDRYVGDGVGIYEVRWLQLGKDEER